MKKLLIIIVLCYFSIIAYGQTHLGIGIDLFQSTLIGVGTGQTTLSGLSGVANTPKKTIGGSFDVMFQSKLNQKLEIEYGTGYFYENEEIEFVNAPTLVGFINTTLDIDLHYIEFPLQLNYALHQHNKTGLVLGMIGLSPKLLVGAKDNLMGITPEQIHIVNHPYSKFLLSGHLAIGFRQLLPNGKHAELLIYQGVGLTRFIKGGWGFYQDLSTSRNKELGIKFKYYFSSLKL